MPKLTPTQVEQASREIGRIRQEVKEEIAQNDREMRERSILQRMFDELSKQCARPSASRPTVPR